MLKNMCHVSNHVTRNSRDRSVKTQHAHSAPTANMSGFKKFTDFLFSKQSLRYMCTTHFWGPVSNFGVPVAAMLDLKKDADLISGPMTGSLIMYSLVFMRYSLAVSPQNYLLFGCHLVNEIAQLGQGFRWANHHFKEKPEPVIEAAPQ